MPLIQVKVKPNSKQQKITLEPDGSLTVQLKSPPVDGKANQELIALLAEQFQVPKSQINIKLGHNSKIKLIEYEI